jgi:hypothetical protein
MDVWLGIWMDILVDIWECVSPPAPAAASAAARLPAAGATAQHACVWGCVRGQHRAPHRQTTPPSVCLGGDRRVCVSAVWSVSRRRAAVRPVSAVWRAAVWRVVVWRMAVWLRGMCHPPCCTVCLVLLRAVLYCLSRAPSRPLHHPHGAAASVWLVRVRVRARACASRLQ